MKFEFTEEERGIIAAGLRDFQARMEELIEEQWKMAEHLVTYIVEGVRI